MTIDWVAFTPWPALAGGMLIGIGASMLMLLNGRVAGISGILGGLLRPVAGDSGWRLAFVAGLVAAPACYLLVAGPPRIVVEAGAPTLIVAGLLVGIGTRYAGGCTSGHGVCGMSRMSLRSVVATLVFMAVGVGTVYVVRHLVGR